MNEKHPQHVTRRGGDWTLLRRLVPLAVAVLMAACGGGERTGPPEGVEVSGGPEESAGAEEHRELANRAGNEGRWSDVIHHLREAIRLGEYHEEERYLLGSVWLRHGDPDEMISYYREAVETDPKPQTSWFFLGRALAKTGDLEEAVGAYRRAVEIDPAHELSHQALAEALEARGELEEAKHHYRRVVEVDPTFRPGWASLLRFVEEHGSESELEEVRRDAAAAAELDPRHRPYYWAKFLAEEGREDAAREELARVLAVDPEFQPARELAEELGMELGEGSRSPIAGRQPD